MRVISISLDSNICKKDSAVFHRMKGYALLTEQMHIICFTLGNTGEWQSNENLFIYPTNSRTMLHFIFDAYRIGKIIIKKNNLTKESTIITSQDPFETGFCGYLLKKRFGFKLNIQDHGNFFESKYWKKESIFNFFRYFLGVFILKRSNTIRTVSSREKKYIEKKFNYNHGNIIACPIFTDWEKISQYEPKFNIKNKYPSFDFYILTICRLEKVKNIPLLINSFSLLVKEFPKILLLIVGNGSQEKNIARIIKQNNLQENIKMEKWTNDSASYYKTADLFALTSFSEGWGLTVVEAASCKCPIVMTNTGCANELIFDQENGWVVPINDPVSLARAIKEAIVDNKKRILFAKNAHDNLKILISEEETLNKIIKIWEVTLTA